MKYAILLTLFLLTACGTDSGNPSDRSPVSDNDGLPTSGIVIEDSLRDKVCEKITSCFDPHLTDCSTQYYATSDYTAHLGLDPATYPDIASVYDALTAGHLSTDATHLNLCVNAIDALTCADAAVLASYDSTQLEDLTHIYHLLQASTACTQIYH